MNEEEDYYDMFGDNFNLSFMGIAEDDGTNNNMGAVFGTGVQDGGNTLQQIHEPANIYQESPHTIETQERVHDIQNAPMELGFLVNPSVVEHSSSIRISSSRRNPLPEDGSFLNDLLLDTPTPSSFPTLTLNPGKVLATKSDRMMNDRSTLLVNSHDTQPKNGTQLEVGSNGENVKPLLELANIAMSELITLGKINSLLWKIDSSSKRETLDYHEYNSFFKNGFEKPPGYVIEASRETAIIHMDRLALVKTFMTDNWINVFAPIVSEASVHKLIPKGSGGPRSGSLSLITAEFQVIFPLVPKRQVKFLRYCEMFKEGVWVVVDFTPRQENLNFSSDDGSYRLPSGVIIEDSRRGCSKVTWIEQIEYDESLIPPLLISSRIGLGAKRWLTTLQRHCKNLSTLANINLDEVYKGMSSKVATEIVKLAQRMTINYYLFITAFQARICKRNDSESEGQIAKVMIRRENVGEHTNTVVSGATYVRLPVSKKNMFDFLSNHSLRNMWDTLAIDITTPIKETFKIPKSNVHRNEVSLLQIEPDRSVLEERWSDESGALLVYAPVVMEEILASGNSDSMQILPSGFSILPDGGGDNDPGRSGEGCLVTFGYQMLHRGEPAEDVDQYIVKRVEEIMNHTIRRIKSALSI